LSFRCHALIYFGPVWCISFSFSSLSDRKLGLLSKVQRESFPSSPSFFFSLRDRTNLRGECITFFLSSHPFPFLPLLPPFPPAEQLVDYIRELLKNVGFSSPLFFFPPFKEISNLVKSYLCRRPCRIFPFSFPPSIVGTVTGWVWLPFPLLPFFFFCGAHLTAIAQISGFFPPFSFSCSFFSEYH